MKPASPTNERWIAGILIGHYVLAADQHIPLIEFERGKLKEEIETIDNGIADADDKEALCSTLRLTRTPWLKNALPRRSLIIPR